MSDQYAQSNETRKAFLKEGAWLRFSSPLFSALLHASSMDEDLIELASSARSGQPVGLLFPIAAYYLLLKSPDQTLARYFPSLSTSPEPASEAFATFREFCLDRREELRDLLARRTVNTNLVERSSCILPCLAYITGLTNEPLTLIEICCSSALNLLLDKYRYDYGPAGRLDAGESPLQLKCRLIGAGRPPIAVVPQIAERVGVDLVKIDPLNSLERLWMEATLCPEWHDEREHLRAALAIRTSHPLRIIEGNALEVLPGLISDLPGSICVLHSYCMGQWSSAAKMELDSILRSAARHRDIHRLALDSFEQESPGSIRDRLVKLAAAGVPLQYKSFPSRIEHTWYTRTMARTQVLGQADGFGAWLDWNPGDVQQS